MPSRGYRKGQSDLKVALPCYLRTRLSTGDLNRLKAEATARGLTQAKLARQILAAHLTQQRLAAPQRHGPTDYLLRQLLRIGNNLNQLARQANTGLVTVSADELRQCLDAVNRMARTF